MPFGHNFPSLAEPTGNAQADWQREQIKRVYQQYLHRDPTGSEYNRYLAGGPDAINRLTNELSQQQAAPPTPETAAPPTTTEEYKEGDYETFGRMWLASGGKTVADLKAFIAKYPSFGAELFGSKGDKVKIGGHSFDAVISAGTGGTGGSWSDITDGGGDGGGDDDGGTFDPTLGGSLLQPWTEAFDFPSFEPGADFKAPEGAAVFEDPGFQFRLAEGEKALQRAASARGTLNTGGTLKALAGYNHGMASTEYGNVYARKASEYDRSNNVRRSDYDREYGHAETDYNRRYNITMANQDRPFNKLSSLAGFGTVSSPQLNSNYQGYGSQAAYTAQQGTDAYNQWLTSAAASRGAGSVASRNSRNSALGNIVNNGWNALMYPNY